ncbi:hypothetical protein AB0957_01050 [Streptomyces zhihengii]|uniref:hypothetical protein n=1 Tax=Streptomyces zhihengii TaxID=1818004 RepID=UPI0034518E22
MNARKKLCAAMATVTTAIAMAVAAAPGATAIQADPNWDSVTQVQTLAADEVSKVAAEPTWDSTPA